MIGLNLYGCHNLLEMAISNLKQDLCVHICNTVYVVELFPFPN